MDDRSMQRLRAELVEDLAARHALRSGPVRRAFLEVPRHVFVPGTAPAEAYRADTAIPTHFDERGVPVSAASAPAIMAVMLELLDVRPGHHVLEIGAGTGYNAALLAHLVGEAGAVTSLDIDEQVAREASAHLAHVGAEGVEILCMDGWHGEDRAAPFDRMIATVECGDISPHWVRQLNEAGVIVLPLALGPGLTMAVALQKFGDRLTSTSMAYCGFMPLRGPHAGPDDRTLVSRRDDTGRGRGEESKWLAVFPGATGERGDVLRSLLAGGVTRVAPAPPLVAGWNVRLVLEEPDAIYLFEAGAVPPRHAAGLFDPAQRSVALVEGDSIVCFGADACLARVASRLALGRPFDLSAMRITATPPRAGRRDEGVVLLRRPSFDLAVEGLDGDRSAD